MSRERDELWQVTLEAYKKAKDEYDSTDPSDEHYDDICKNLNDVMDKILKMDQEDKKLRWDKIKFGVGTGVSVLQTIGTFAFGTVMLDWEQANSMTSKFWPVVQKMLPAAWKMTNSSM